MRNDKENIIVTKTIIKNNFVIKKQFDYYQIVQPFSNFQITKFSN